MSLTKFEQIIGNPRVFKMILDEVMHDWSSSYDIMPVESSHDRQIKDYEKFSKFCQKIRSNEEGLRRCMQCDLDFSKAAGKSGKPMHYLCHAGLLDIVVPIVVEGELIATIFCGQHRIRDANVEGAAVARTKKTEKDLGFKQGELLKLRKKIPTITFDKVKDVQEKLLEVATYVSNLGSSKLEAKKVKNETDISGSSISVKVFFCHSSKDRAKVRQYFDRLKNEKGIDPWIDVEKLLPGADWDLEIKSTVKSSDIVLVFLSKHSVNKEGYVQKEIKQALDVADEKPDGTIFIIPLRLEDCDVPERLKRWHWLDLFEDDSYNRLLTSLRKRSYDLTIKNVGVQ